MLTPLGADTAVSNNGEPHTNVPVGIRLADLLAQWHEREGDLRAFSLLQPWASLIALGEKHIETRSWSTTHRGAYFIHASGRWITDDLRLAISQPDYVAAWNRHPTYARRMRDIPLGSIVAIGRLVACLPTNELEGQLRAQYEAGTRATIAGVTCRIAERVLGNYEPGRYGFVTADIHRFATPLECKGNRCFWRIDDRTREALEHIDLIAA